MEFEKLVRERVTVRKFSTEPIEDGIIKEILTTATYACNSGNEQNWEFVVVKQQQTKDTIGDIIRRKVDLLNRAVKSEHINMDEYKIPDFFLEAPILIFAFSTGKYKTKADIIMERLGKSEKEVADLRGHSDVQTVAAAIQIMLLAAWNKGIGGCWLTGPLYARYELEEFFQVDYKTSLVAIVALGRAKIIPQRCDRKKLEEIVSFWDN